MNEDKPQKKVPFSSIFNAYATEVSRYPWQFWGVLGGILLIQVSELVTPVYFKKFFDQLASGDSSILLLHALFITLAFIAFFRFLGWLSRRIFTLTLNYLESSVMTGLYERAFSYLLGHSYRFFTQEFGGTLTRRVSKFAGAFESLFDVAVFQLIPTAIFMIGAIWILSLRNYLLGLILFAWTIVFVTVQIIFARIHQPIRELRAKEDSRVVGTLSDAITNQNTISLFSALSFEAQRFGDAVRSWRHATLRSWNANEMIWSVLGLLIIAIQIGLLYGALIFWQRGLLTVGDFVLIQAYLLSAFDHLININQQLRRFYDGIADAAEMITILDTPHEVKDRSNAKLLAVSTGAVIFDEVNFAFNTEHAVFTHFNLEIGGGQKVALVGHSGAGKSTVTRLLLRFYDVQSGSIRIDGQDLRDVTQDSLRDAIAYVPQEPILFHRTLMDNIRYGRRNATDEEVIAAAKEAHCHEFIDALPDRYETFVGERGVKLSGGERQRVAIARAILKNAPILILDEATSSLDSESEALIQEALERLMQGKTVIAVAHRLSTIMRMDRIVVMEGGKAVLSGTHDELISHEGNLYKKLWEIQAGGFIRNDE